MRFSARSTLAHVSVAASERRSGTIVRKRCRSRAYFGSLSTARPRRALKIAKVGTLSRDRGLSGAGRPHVEVVNRGCGRSAGFTSEAGFEESPNSAEQMPPLRRETRCARA